MNILYLNHNVIWKSTFHRCFLFARELVLRGHAVTILTNSRNDKFMFKQYVEEGVNIVETPDVFWSILRTGWDPLNVIRRCVYLWDKHFDIVHAFDTRPTVILPALFYTKFIYKVPLIIDWSDWWGRGGVNSNRSYKFFNKFFAPIETFFEEYFRHFAKVSTVCSALLKRRLQHLGIPENSITIIPNGIDTRSIYPVGKLHARKYLHISSKARICIFSGYVLYDLPILLNAFTMVVQKNSNSLLLLLGDYQGYIFGKNVINNPNIRIVENVRREQLRYYLSAADVAILPLADTIANRARFPMKFGDYVAAKIPIITSDVGEVGEYCKKYHLGIFTNNTSDAIAQCILKIFTGSTKNNAHSYVNIQKRLSYKTLVSTLDMVYKVAT
jgi:glycosyltransferase involved in cell wall biosynthesis